MSTIASTNIKHPSSATNNITLASTGAVAVNGSMTGAGLDLITPTSIAYSGGSASVSGGQITFSGISSISLNGCFSSTYENYRIIIRASHPSGEYLNARLRSSGTDNTASSYQYNSQQAFNTSWTALRAGAASATIGDFGYFHSTSAGLFCDISGPALTAPTSWIYTGSYFTGTTHSSLYGATIHSASTSFDGITFYPLSSTITGTIRVYGYKNS